MFRDYIQPSFAIGVSKRRDDCVRHDLQHRVMADTMPAGFNRYAFKCQTMSIFDRGVGCVCGIEPVSTCCTRLPVVTCHTHMWWHDFDKKGFCIYSTIGCQASFRSHRIYAKRRHARVR